ncbi:MAG TPA: GH92 family glycosyl hydrolase [Chitinophagaceae bacterium]|nr:GH92 family glycosyl hydrolase [Chitinophagaceae bacterium]
MIRMGLFTCLCLLMMKGVAQKLTDKVDVFMGTGGHGHVYPGATVPFGMVQLSPDNGREGWDWSSGYHYSSDSIAGFSHTHLSGTGIGDWCDISVMPTLNSNADVRTAFSHQNESGRPGYYKVQLNNGIVCEMTATERVGFHRYFFPGNNAWLHFNMGFHINWDKPTDGFLQLLNDSTLLGYRFSTGWAKNQRVFFAARFSAPVLHKVLNDSMELRTAKGADANATLQFSLQGKPLVVRVALSSVSTAKALQELDNSRNLNFDTVQNRADQLWEKELEKITITAPPSLEKKFYTSLYRTCLAPVVYSDADGQYRNQDGVVHRSKGTKYTVFSLWDTFRAAHPLFTLTQPDRVKDMLNSLLSFYNNNGLLPVWDLSTWETNTMTGYHSIPVLADAILKGVKGIDVTTAYSDMLKSAYQQQRGVQDYIRFGYLPQDKHGWSVTITLEYAFDDWCIAQVAKKLGKTNDYKTFMQRSQSYQRLFDPLTGFMRAKDSSGKFIEPFDPLRSEHGFDGQYIEGNAWQHSFFVPHDIAGLAKLYGGKDSLLAKLDKMFSSTSELHGDNVSGDITGLIGQYAHGNEPSHHIIYMYTVLGHPEKAAAQIKIVVDSMYKPGPDGLSGNDDCGQMSAWLVWTSLGMYPLNPASGVYVFGYPLIENATLQLPNGQTLSIITHRQKTNSPAGIQKVVLNGQKLSGFVKHTDLLKGGKLEYFITGDW